MIFTLWTVSESNGDGSYGTRLFATEEEANGYADNLEESSGEDVGGIDLKLEDGRLYFQEFGDLPDGTLGYRWVELHESV